MSTIVTSAGSIRKRSTLFVALVALCASLPMDARADDPASDSIALQDQVDAALLQSGQDINAQYSELMAARGSVAPTALPAGPSHVPLANVPKELAQPINLSWNGSSVELTSKIADAIGYRFVLSGTSPVAPAVVTMVFRGEPAIWALQDLGIRIRDTASLGEEQAFTVFKINLNRLNREYIGMIRWCRLVATGEATTPIVSAEMKPVVGGGDEVTINEGKVTIVSNAVLLPRQD